MGQPLKTETTGLKYLTFLATARFNCGLRKRVVCFADGMVKTDADGQKIGRAGRAAECWAELVSGGPGQASG